MMFLHTADWQIGKGYGSFEAAEAALLAEARFEVVAGIAEMARGDGADLVLVAGDVFDAQGVADRTILRLFQAMSGYRGPWVMIPGNHDAALAESVWSRAVRLGAIGSNVHLCLRPQPLVLDTPGVAILPAPLTQRHTFADLTAWFDAAETPAGLPRIGLAHGSVQGILAEDIDAANPIAPGRAASARLDYLALGDWHGVRQVDERTWYSGTPETDRFRNNDSGQVLRVRIDAPGAAPLVTPLRTGRYRWLSLSRELRVGSDLAALVEELARLERDDVVQLEIAGGIDLEGHLELERALADAQARARSLSVELGGLRIHPSAEDLQALRADGYLGEVIEQLRRDQEGSDAQTARDALGLLARALERTGGAVDDGAPR
ncbi:MAG: metallophosphoesterase [Betaproteobacteria bacterium]|nr:metallophosphoesterase [Betaproteobacteria bacterium]